MAQRTEFPALNNLPEASYPSMVQSLFQEINRLGNNVPFKTLRPWLKEHNIYDKEQVDDLFFFLGCTYQPEVTTGDFPKQYMECKTPEDQQHLLYTWVNAWNPFLTKYVFEALDVDGGGRLHSTHELYRLITSYVYAGEYVTLPNFQNWIKWMAASSYIKYIGIRWGLSPLGKAAMKSIRMLDVDEMLEDEAEEAEAATQETPAIASPPEKAPTASNTKKKAETSGEELPDMPPEAPIPDWEPPADHPLADAASEATEPVETTEATKGKARKKSSAKSRKAPETRKSKKRANKTPAAQSQADVIGRVNTWFSTYQARQPDRASDLGLDAKQYGKNPPLFLYKVMVLARLATGELPVEVWEPLYRQLISDNVLNEYFNAKRSLEALVSQQQWYESQPNSRDALSSIAFDVMRGKALLRGQQALCDQLEDAPDGPALLKMIHERVFMGELTAAPFWMMREMAQLGIWDNPALSSHLAVPTATVRANACRLGLLTTQYAHSFDALLDAAETLASQFPDGDYALAYVHDGLAGAQRLTLPYRKKV